MVVACDAQRGGETIEMVSLSHCCLNPQAKAWGE